MSKNKIGSNDYVTIAGKYYLVEDYPLDPFAAPYVDDPGIFKKGVAYRYNTDLTHLLLPYRGQWSDQLRSELKPGLWTKRERHFYRIVIIRPSPKELPEYKIGNERNLVSALINYEMLADDFRDNDLNTSDIGTELYLPPVHADDDFLSMIMKLAIQLKNAPFDPYGRRMEALFQEKGKTVAAGNIRNNRRRAHRVNRTMTPSKFKQDAETWQVEPAVIVRDMPGSMHKMGLPENSALIIYPEGIPFDLKSMNLIDASDYLAKAIVDDLDQETYESDEDDED